ncbi:HXXEE domain-containing protein [Rhodoplanes roseus]|uniref:HXXEE domain-containing protein n=1 Tax=Rhodoplanes roseus TaxID=29409 RepID=A0A327L2W2_9BRAD|nr:HXXEE domain-containing protein [Rhodoplanes roseus]RAI44365.1 hypothetical protein CH341_09425 [Rhodoplanes roseus]
MDFYRRNWYWIGMYLFAAIAFFLGFGGNKLFSDIQLILIYSFMGFLVHQYEEYGAPGGFPGIFNVVLGERDVIDRYPTNANLVMINNVFMTYPFYILAVIFPGAIWFGLIQVGQGMAQILNHGIYNNLKFKSIYNPGLGAVIFVNWPIGLYYIWHVSTNNLATTTDYVLGFIGAILSLVVLWAIPVSTLRDKNTKYPYAESQMYGVNDWAKEKVLQIKNS